MDQRFAVVGLVHHRRQNHEPVDSGFLRIAGEPARERRCVFGYSGKHRNSASNHLQYS